MTPVRAAVLAALGGTICLSSQTAWSQQDEQAQLSGGLEEIVVTAARREQNLQDVPLAVVAFTGESLEINGGIYFV